MKKQFLETGIIVGTHGIRGEMRVQPWCDSPEFLTRFHKLFLDADGRSELVVQSARVHKNIVLLTAQGVDDIESAERYRGKVLFIRRQDVPLQQGDYFVQDLIGCTVADADSGEEYGTLSEVSVTGANDVWHIWSEANKREYLIPAIPDVVADVDVERERILIRPLKGIFDDEN